MRVNNIPASARFKFISYNLWLSGGRTKIPDQVLLPNFSFFLFSDILILTYMHISQATGSVRISFRCILLARISQVHAHFTIAWATWISYAGFSRLNPSLYLQRCWTRWTKEEGAYGTMASLQRNWARKAYRHKRSVIDAAMGLNIYVIYDGKGGQGPHVGGQRRNVGFAAD